MTFQGKLKEIETQEVPEERRPRPVGKEKARESGGTSNPPHPTAVEPPNETGELQESVIRKAIQRASEGASTGGSDKVEVDRD